MKMAEASVKIMLKPLNGFARQRIRAMQVLNTIWG